MRCPMDWRGIAFWGGEVNAGEMGVLDSLNSEMSGQLCEHSVH